MEEKYHTQIAELRNKLKSPKRVINQSLKRKIEQLGRKSRKIQDLKRKLHGNSVAQELERTRAEL